MHAQNQRGQGQNHNQYGQANNTGPPPRGHANQNVERKKYHLFYGRYHVQGQSWSEGQNYGCSNCGGHHPLDECCQPDKVIRPNSVANPQQQAQENVRGARPQGAVAKKLRPPNLYYDHRSARQTFPPPAILSRTSP